MGINTSAKADVLRKLRRQMNEFSPGPSADSHSALDTGTPFTDDLPYSPTSAESGYDGLHSMASEHSPLPDDFTAQKAYQKILRLASVREQSTLSVRDRLRRDGYPPDVIDEAIDHAVRVHAINDQRYAEALIRSRLAAGKGIEPLREEIDQLGIDIQALDAYQEYLAEGDDYDFRRAYAFLETHPPRAKNKRDAAYRKLMQRGFSSAVSSEAAGAWVRHVSDDAWPDSP